ncbi:MAG: hypothetical protein ABI758_02320 [Candidatus Woesebacteria bacterium]
MQNKKIGLFDTAFIVSTILFLGLTGYWLFIFLTGSTSGALNDNFGFLYGGLSVWAGIWGLVTAYQWGGLKSLMGKALIFLSVGLLFQGFGQYSFWFFNVFLHVEIPYPGVPDIGYFGSIPFYIIAAYQLFRVSGTKFTLRANSGKIRAILVPLLMLGLGYTLFLRGYTFDWSDPLKIFLDFGYPLGQAVYISFAIITYTLSRKLLGGKMRMPFLILIAAFIAQFVADYSFLYFQETFFAGSFIDYIYLLSYALMTLGILYFRYVAKQIKHSS